MGSSRSLIAELKANGWVQVSQNGSHVKFKKGDKTVIVPHPKKDLKIGLEKQIRKHAGLSERA